MGVERAVGWDVGGAHLKLAWVAPDGRIGDAIQFACPLWKGADHFDQALALAQEWLGREGATLHALTMSGELVDAFADRAEGVRTIVARMAAFAGQRRLYVYAGSAGFVTPEEALAQPAAVASMNWRASAQWAAEALQDGLLLDIGSTTTDAVPFRAGRIEAAADTDAGRLRTGELVYTGVVRTPVFAMAARVPFAGEWLPLMAEEFATAADVHRLTGQLPEGADQQPSADGAAKSLPDSARRLARVVGRDSAEAPHRDWCRLADFLADEQRTCITRTCRQVLSRVALPDGSGVVGAGVGRFLAREVAARLLLPYRDFGALWPAASPQWHSSATEHAPAAALSELVRRHVLAAAN